MNLSELTATIYLAANDYAVGQEFPPLEIERITLEDVPTPGKAQKTKKGVVYLKGAPKGWVANKQELRKMALAYGASQKIEQSWLGHYVAIKVVGGVRRPDGTTGNAFRVLGAWKRGEQPQSAKGATVPAPAATDAPAADQAPTDA
jgi:hypothetical protein